jgi:uncharacterized protein (DUF2141 family)
MAALAPVLVAAVPAGSDVSVSIHGLRANKGRLLACLTTKPAAFPDCSKDPASRKLSVPAADGVRLDFGPVPDGQYAFSLVHDENDNGRMDKRLMMPVEGYGFSRDAPVRMGPPRFDQASFRVSGAPVQLSVKVRYLF